VTTEVTRFTLAAVWITDRARRAVPSGGTALGAFESPEADAAEEAEAERDLQSMGIVARDQPDDPASPAVSVDHQTWVGARRVGSNIQVRTETPADIRLAIKELRLLKREAQARKKELTLARSEENAEWRERQAGRYSTVGMGRGTGARIFRAGLQGKRRTERMGHADRINQIAAGQGAIDREILAIDGLIAQCEAALLRSE
jgi:hypothetical protein